MGDDSGLVIVYTGKGKGKTTAALGIVLRAVGHGFKVAMVQFIKGSWYYGELTSSARLKPDFELIAAGKGFVGIIDDAKPIEDHVRAAKEALQISREKITSGKYDIVILDEINYAVNLKLVTAEDVLELIKIRPENTTLVLTGNHASEKVIEVADLVTEMKEIKHPYQQGRKAKRGIDF
ncbi:MAG: cob(I)yrinic acid a,c-diamide adenosyltransferase [Nitrososphaerales archaeon]